MKIQFLLEANQPKKLPKPWKGQPVLVNERTILLSSQYPNTIKIKIKFSLPTLAVRRLVPKITRRVFAENISAF